MKINRSIMIAILALLLIGAWFAVQSGKKSDKTTPPPPSVISKTDVDALPTVVVEWRVAVDHPDRFSLYGRTQANREVTLKAETVGLVKSIPVREGRQVKRGTVICRQDTNARQALLDQARAAYKKQELEYKASETLVAKGYRSETQLATAQAALDGARASVKQAEIELDNVNMRAPFAGIFEKKIAEIGDYLGPGQPCGLLVELDPLKIIVELTEQQVGRINLDQSAQIELATGESLTGTISKIESRADPATRTFKAEITAPNSDMSLKAGVTATATVSAGITKAHNVPAKIMSLDDNGNVGIRYVDVNDIVRFAVTQTIDEDQTGVWVTGLPESTRIIVQGQDFVSSGTQVEPRQIEPDGNAP